MYPQVCADMQTQAIVMGTVPEPAAWISCCSADVNAADDAHNLQHIRVAVHHAAKNVEPWTEERLDYPRPHE